MKLNSFVFIILGCVYFFLIFFVLCNIPFLQGINPVFYYRSCLLLLLSLVIWLLTAFLLRKFLYQQDVKDYALALTVAFTFHFCFLSVGLVSLDRSISVFLLSYMANNEEQAFSKQDMKDIFLDIYMERYDGMQRRIDEQLLTGTIEDVGGGKYRITNKGYELVQSWKFLADMFPLDERYLETYK